MIPVGIIRVKAFRQMARKTAARRASTRERIFGTAAELFYRRGIRAVGVEAIAAAAATTKMGIYRNFPSKDDLVAEWLRRHDANFWRTWERMACRHPDDPRRQLKAAFALLEKHVREPGGRGCAMANAAVEITEKDHPARKVIETHKARLRARLAEVCRAAGVSEPELLADQLFLLMEGAQVTTVTLGVRGPAKNVARAAEALIDSQV
jgi:AcrR family transcriptional regulator